MILMTLFYLSQTVAEASERQRINPIGVSYKGQFVAFEEYSYVPVKRTYVVNIRIMNVWTKEFVGKKIHLEYPARKPYSLDKVRKKARLLATDELLKFKIST